MALRAQNYLGEPVYVTVKISQGVQAQVNREFVIRNTLINPRPARTSCGSQECAIGVPIEDYRSDFGATVVQNLALRARLFGPGDAEIATCPGCANDDATQTYVFQIPARTAGPIEYTFLTYLRATVPAGQGTNVTMAPSDASHPDTDPDPYTEFMGLTGKLMGPPGTSLICTSQENDAGTFTCTQKSVRQRYRAITKIQFQLLQELDTAFSFAASPVLPSRDDPNSTGKLPLFTTLATDEGSLP